MERNEYNDLSACMRWRSSREIRKSDRRKNIRFAKSIPIRLIVILPPSITYHCTPLEVEYAEAST